MFGQYLAILTEIRLGSQRLRLKVLIVQLKFVQWLGSFVFIVGSVVAHIMTYHLFVVVPPSLKVMSCNKLANDRV